jgi:hypothetical protein
MIIGFVLWMGVISDPSGKLRTPSIGSIFYVAAVIGVAAFLAHSDRHRALRWKERETQPKIWNSPQHYCQLKVHEVSRHPSTTSAE